MVFYHKAADHNKVVLVVITFVERYNEAGGADASCVKSLSSRRWKAEVRFPLASEGNPPRRHFRVLLHRYPGFSVFSVALKTSIVVLSF